LSSKRGITVAIAVVVLIAAGGALALSSSTTQKKSITLCASMADFQTYAKTHPPKHTYPDLKNNVVYDQGVLLEVANEPAAEQSQVAAAISSSKGMLSVINAVIAGQHLSHAAMSAGVAQIKVWQSSTGNLFTWSKSHCQSSAATK
jgi:hypothetical protein